jgi:hypothetical protein
MIMGGALDPPQIENSAFREGSAGCTLSQHDVVP